jgi:hypothetical protein
MTDYVATLVTLVPNARISYTGLDPDYDAIEWQDDRPQPSRAECDEAWPQVKTDLETAAAQRSRANAYREEADPLFFKWQRGEGSEKDWIDKVTEIRELFPYSVSE